MTIAAITGLEAEARIVRRLGIIARPTGARPERAAILAEKLLADGALGLLSFGIAGALAPDLRSGAIVLPRRVCTEAGATFTPDPEWHARVQAALRARGIATADADLLAARDIVASADAKAELHRRTRTIAVDLESHALAAAAARAGRPFLVLRAIADPADFTLPQGALVGVDANGRTALLPVLRSVLRQPGQVGDLLRLARHTQAALAALERVTPLLRDLSPSRDGR
jgi:adenosylhomocysteine nucleosidase